MRFKSFKKAFSLYGHLTSFQSWAIACVLPLDNYFFITITRDILCLQNNIYKNGTKGRVSVFNLSFTFYVHPTYKAKQKNSTVAFCLPKSDFHLLRHHHWHVTCSAKSLNEL